MLGPREYRVKLALMAEAGFIFWINASYALRVQPEEARGSDSKTMIDNDCSRALFRAGPSQRQIDGVP